VISKKRPIVIPAKAGIQFFNHAKNAKLDPGLRRDDDAKGFAA
jgi:hypothetical protein